MSTENSSVMDGQLQPFLQHEDVAKYIIIITWLNVRLWAWNLSTTSTRDSVPSSEQEGKRLSYPYQWKSNLSIKLAGLVTSLAQCLYHVGQYWPADGAVVLKSTVLTFQWEKKICKWVCSAFDTVYFTTNGLIKNMFLNFSPSLTIFHFFIFFLLHPRQWWCTESFERYFIWDVAT